MLADALRMAASFRLSAVLQLKLRNLLDERERANVAERRELRLLVEAAQ